MDLIKVLKERANLFRAQVHPGSNIFDQAAGRMSELERENKKLAEELTFCENMLKMFGEIELAETPEKDLVGYADADGNYILQPSQEKLS